MTAQVDVLRHIDRNPRFQLLRVPHAELCPRQLKPCTLGARGASTNVGSVKIHTMHGSNLDS
jgi:hypothetical protein